MGYKKSISFVFTILNLASCTQGCAPTDPTAVNVSRCCENGGLGPVCKIFDDDNESMICASDYWDACET